MTKTYCKTCGYYEEGECCYFGDRAEKVEDCKEHSEHQKEGEDE